MKNVRCFYKGLALLLAAGLLAGCQLPGLPGLPGTSGEVRQTAAETEVAAEKQGIISVNDHPVTEEEARVWLYLAAQPYEACFGSGIWQCVHPEGGLFEDRLRESVENQIVELTVLSDLAEEAGLSLTEDEKADCRSRAKALLEAAPALAEAGTDEGSAARVYETSLLAGKYYAQETAGMEVALTEAEKADCQVLSLMQIFIGAEDDAHTGEGQTPQQLAQDLQKRVAAGEDFKTLAEAFNSENACLSFVMNAKGYAFDVDARVDNAVAQAALSLTAGQVSPVIQGEMGWYILKCLSVSDEALCRQAEAAALEKKKADLFLEDQRGSIEGAYVITAPAFGRMELID